MPTPRAGWLGALIVLTGAALFGFLGVGSRLAYDAGMQPVAFVAWRAAVGALALALVIVAARGPRAAVANVLQSAPGARGALVLAMALGAGVNLSIFLAFDRTTIALALLGFYTYPAMIAATSALLGREPLDLTRVLALGLALAGMVAVVLGGLDAAVPVRVDALGIALGLAAGAFQTGFVLTSRRYASIRADMAIAIVLVGSAVIAAVITIATDGVAALLMPFGSPSLLALLAGIGLFAAALPSVLFLTGIRWIGGVRTGILMLFEPVVGVALAALFLLEGLTLLQAIGGATILLAAFIVQRGSHVAVPDGAVVAPAPGGP